MINEKDAFNDKLRHSHFLSVGFAPHQHRVDLVNFYEKENYNDDKVLWSALWKNKTISDVFNDIPKLKDMCFNSNGKILNNVNIFLNGKKIDSYSNINIKLNDEDELTIFPPVAGGI